MSTGDIASAITSTPEIEHAKQCIWDYMLMKHELRKAKAIVVLGSFDTNVGVYAAELYLAGWAPLLICAGSGTVNQSNPAWGAFEGSTEAEVFRDIAIKAGVPTDHILIENRSQNTGQNYEFTTELLRGKGIDIDVIDDGSSSSAPVPIIVVQKQFMERRTYATGKIWWPRVDIIVTSPPMTMQDYPLSNPCLNVNGGEHWIHAMVGDLQRIKIYPEKGFQIAQEMPDEVWGAYEVLVQAGYDKCVIRA